MNASLRRALLASLAAFLLLAPAAHAQLFRAYVASDGNDANPCSLPAPCRLLPAALAAVASGGEIWMLDTANYNTSTVTIGKSVTILAIPGAVGSLVAAGGPAIHIAGGGFQIALRNLVIVPLPGAGGTNGVLLTGNSDLFVEGCLFANHHNNGVYVFGVGRARITSSTFRNNGEFGVIVENGGGATITDSGFHRNFGGVFVLTTLAGFNSRAALTRSTFAGNVTAVSVLTQASAKALAHVTDSTLDAGSSGLVAETNGSGTAAITLNRSLVSNMDFGYKQIGTGSAIRSLGNNVFVETASNTGVLTQVAAE